MLLTRALPEQFSFIEIADWVKKWGLAEDFTTFFVIAISLWGWHNLMLYENFVLDPKHVTIRLCQTKPYSKSVTIL